MADVIITPNNNIKVRIGEFIVRNGVTKSIDWNVTGVPVRIDGTYGNVMASISVSEPVDATLAMLTPPAGTVVDIGGMQVDISDLSGLKVQAWLQWHGEALCEQYKPEIMARLGM